MIKNSKLQGKNVFRNDYFGSQSFFMSNHFTKIFVHLSVLAAVSTFNVYTFNIYVSLSKYLIVQR